MAASVFAVVALFLAPAQARSQGGRTAPHPDAEPRISERPVAPALSPLHTLTTTAVGDGSLRRDPDLESYPEGSHVAVTPTPSPGWHFVDWSGDASGTANPLEVTMNRDKAITATFAINTYTLTVRISGEGIVTQQPLQARYDHGTIVQLTATPFPDNHFSSWMGDANSAASPIKVTMNADKTILVTFKPNGARFELPDGFTHQLVVSGLDEPVGMAFLPDGRMLVVERATAHIRLIVEGTLGYVDPVCVVDSVTSAEGERGLLGIAVDPQWPQRPFVYVYYTALGGTIRLSRFEASGNLTEESSGMLWIDASSRYDVLRDLSDQLEYHNGGALRFGPDGMLYVGVGDDGYACTAQDTSSLRGVMLRLDVSRLPGGSGGPPSRASLVPADNPWASSIDVNQRLVWAIGLRNPFSFHIDPANGAAFVADVGLIDHEEIDRIAAPGQDLGWPYFEGPMALASCGGVSSVPGLVLPIHSYERNGVTSAVIGAGVYRGHGCQFCDFPSQYEGDYFFSDFYQGFLRRLKFSGGTWSLAAPVLGQPNATDWGRGFEYTSAFLPGPDGALWYCRFADEYQPVTGEVGRILFAHPTTAVEEGGAAPIMFAPPYPSPARDLVHFVYTLPADAAIELSVFDVSGRVVRQLLRTSQQSAGRHHLAWDGHMQSGASVPPGIYLARLLVDGQSVTRRVVFAR